jgi:uncharacterized protein (DUF2147 family)
MKRLGAALAAIGLALVSGAAAQAPSSAPAAPLGRWLSESKRGVIEIFPCGDRLCGKLVWLIEPLRRGAPAMDDKNPDPALRQRPLCGLMMLADFRQTEPQRWEDGWIYDPDSGSTYHATMRLEDGLLKLRGYVGIPLLGETQTWTRPDGRYGTSC